MTREADAQKNSRKYLDDLDTEIIVMQLTRGPYQNNGATPWYAYVPIGTPDQTMKMAFDTGSNFMWVTSALCAENGNACQHYGNSQFNDNISTSFTWVDQSVQTVDFGPWGSMDVETGRDGVGFASTESATTFYLSENYSGAQFKQLDWDGGIGLPSGTAYAKPGASFVVGDLYNAGALNPWLPYVSFGVDFDARRGSCILGGYDLSECIQDEYIYFPWTPYDPYPPVNYMWNCAVDSIDVGVDNIAANQYFCLDTGSS
ncbi:MAG: A1 family peptidase, partial [Sphingomonadales bacterium]|nr:A1 family peptidase [Sphingomonadales bacterium]